MRLGLGLGLDRQQRGAGGLPDPIPGLGAIAYFRGWDADQYLNASAAPATDGEAIAVKLDSTSFGNHYAQSEGSRRPLLSVTGGPNGTPTAIYDGIDDRLTRIITGADGATGATLVFVAKVDADPAVDGSNGSPFDGFNGTSAPSVIPYSGNGFVGSNFASATRHDQAPLSPALASWNIYTIMSKDGEWTFKLNGVVTYTTASNTFSISDLVTVLGFNKFGADNYYVPYRGRISALAIFPTFLSPADVLAVNQLFSSKTGIVLP